MNTPNQPEPEPEPDAFSLLQPAVQDRVFQLGWKELRQVQVRAIRAFTSSPADLVIVAQTASGKTEAAALPVISSVLANPKPSLQVLIVSPLRALINDQFDRLTKLTKTLDVPVWRWHSDVPGSAKNQLLKNPRGMLTITPESLEARLMKHPDQIQKLFGELDYIVIDELHVFLGEERGAHLASLLSRLQDAIGRRPRRLALSATMGDLQAAKSFLNPDNPESVVVIEEKGHDREIRAMIRTLIWPAHVRDPKTDTTTIIQMSASEILQAANSLDLTKSVVSPFKQIPIPTVDQAIDPLDRVASEVLKLTEEGSSLCFCNQRQMVEGLAKLARELASQQGWNYDPVYLHHSSLDKKVREQTEEALKSGKHVVSFNTSSLELGIDIGVLDRICQVQPPGRVSSLKQRAGRSGRKDEQPTVLRQFTIDLTPTPGSTLSQWLFPNFLAGNAMIRLLIRNQLEPHGPDRYHVSTLVHQTMAVLFQRQPVPLTDLYETLCVRGPFRKIDRTMFEDAMRSLLSFKLIDLTSEHSLVLGSEGERMTSRKDFFVAFKVRSVFLVRHDGGKLGEIESAALPKDGDVFTLDGRNWRVKSINRVLRVVNVMPAPAGSPPTFRGDPVEWHTMLLQEMRAVLMDADEPPYVDKAGRLLLSAIRTVARKARLESRTVIQSPEGTHWLPWLGTAGMHAIQLYCLAYEHRRPEVDRLSFFFPGMAIPEFKSLLGRFLDPEVDPVRLAAEMKNKCYERFDHFLPERLLDRVNAQEKLDMDGARLAAQAALAELGETVS